MLGLLRASLTLHQRGGVSDGEVSWEAARACHVHRSTPHLHRTLPLVAVQRSPFCTFFGSCFQVASGRRKAPRESAKIFVPLAVLGRGPYSTSPGRSPSPLLLLRGTIVLRTYDKHETLHFPRLLLTIFDFDYQ